MYLKRASVVFFDGLTSGDSIVLRAKDNRIARLLPFVLNTDAFWDYADQHADGTMSKRLSPKTLMQYEFDLPDDDQQDYLADTLWAAAETMASYQNLLTQTDELVKSQFIEMFHSYDAVPAGSIMHGMRNGVSPSKSGKHYEKILTLSAITQGAFDANAWKDGFFDSCPPSEKRVSSSDFYMCRGNGNKTLVGTGVCSIEDRADLVFPDTVIAAHVDEHKVCLPYLCVAWNQPSVRRQIEAAARTTNGIYKINQSIISNIEVILPPLPLQYEFANYIEQTYKSKFKLKQAIESVSDLIKSLMQQTLATNRREGM